MTRFCDFWFREIRLFKAFLLYNYGIPSKIPSQQGAVFILDDMILEKPYTDENAINYWHFSHAKHRHLKANQAMFKELQRLKQIVA